MAQPVNEAKAGQSLRTIRLTDLDSGEKNEFGDEVGPKGEKITKGGLLTLAKSIV